MFQLSLSSWKAGHAAQPQPSSLAQHSHSPAQRDTQGAEHRHGPLPTLVAMEPGWVPSPGGRAPLNTRSQCPQQSKSCVARHGLCSSKAKDPEEETDL